MPFEDEKFKGLCVYYLWRQGYGIQGQPYVIRQKGILMKEHDNILVRMLSAAMQSEFVNTLSKLRGFQQERHGGILKLLFM